MINSNVHKPFEFLKAAGATHFIRPQRARQRDCRFLTTSGTVGSVDRLPITIKNNVNSTRLTSLLQGLLLAAALFLSGCETAPPVQEMSDARQAIAVAREAGAEELAAIHLKAAEFYLKSAEEKLNKQEFSQARSDARQAKMKALDALRFAEKAVDPVPGDTP